MANLSSEHLAFIHWDDENEGWKAVCKKCAYEGPLVGDKLLANVMLKRHCARRDHLTNVASPTRFTL